MAHAVGGPAHDTTAAAHVGNLAIVKTLTYLDVRDVRDDDRLGGHHHS